MKEIGVNLQEKTIVERYLQQSEKGFEALQEIKAFCCCGCGLCVSICPAGAIGYDYETKRPVLAGSCKRCGFCYLACPRSFLPLTKIRKRFFGEPQGEDRKRLGNFQDIFVARSCDETIYRGGTPGGTTTALVHHLMETGAADAALLTRGRHRGVEYCMHAEPYIALSADEVLESAHSKFEISPVLSRLGELAGHKRSLFVGTPCHITAFRKLQVIAGDAYMCEALGGLAVRARHLTEAVRFAVSINCYLNHTSMDDILSWLDLDEGDILKFNENVSKDLYVDALSRGKDWRWFFRNNVVTQDGTEREYDVYELGRRVLPSGCLVCESEMTSCEADASIGMFGAETGVNEVGWNSVVVLRPGLDTVFKEMAALKKIERKPFLRGYGRTIRKVLEFFMNTLWRPRDAWGVEHYLKTGRWRYPSSYRRLQGPRRTYMMGLELVYLAQTIRRKVFREPTLKALRKANAYLQTIY